MRRVAVNAVTMASYSNAAATTLFVANLPWTTKEEDLREYMQTAGTVVRVEVQTHADTGRSKGWALVEFATADMAQFAIQQFHEKDFQGRNLNIRLDRSGLESLGGVTLFVGNLPWSCKDAELQTLFAQYRPLDAHVKTFHSGKSRGFGIVRLADDATAQQAIGALNGYEMDGRNIEVREERPRPEPGTAPARRAQKPRAPAAAAAPQQAAVEEPSTTLYVSNLSWSSTDDDLFQHFSSAGAIPDSAKVQYNEKTSRSRGWGLVVFKTVDDAERARASLNKSELDGRPISVRFDMGRP